MAEAAGTVPSGKLVIQNIGLLLSGDIDRPILDADTLVAQDGLITAVGRAADLDIAHADLRIDSMHEFTTDLIEQAAARRALRFGA